MVSVAIARATRPAVMNLIELVKVIKSRLSERSTIKPIGIAKSSHGNITNALSIEIRIGSFVSEIAKSGAATAPLTIKGPSRTNGEVCLKDLEVRTDPSPNRVNGYQATLDGKNLKDINCIPVAAGESLISRTQNLTTALSQDLFRLCLKAMDNKTLQVKFLFHSRPK